MATSTGFTDVVLFELPTRGAAHRLVGQLALSRLAWIQEDDDVCIVGTFLQLDGTDFAQLLRTVEEWVAMNELGAIRFEVDGRTYVLTSKQPALAYAA